MGRSKWGQWAIRLLAALNTSGGLMTNTLSVAAIVISSVGVVYQVFPLYAGIVVGSAGVCYLLYEAIRAWPRQLTPEQVRDRQLTLSVIERLPQTCVYVALVGVGSAGKTTLREHLCNRQPAKIHTSAPEMVVIDAPSPVGLIALLDAAGEDLTQQFEILNHADCVVLLLDHDTSDKATRPRATRRAEQEYFVSQLLFKLAERQKAGKAIRAIHLLRNKHDLWVRAAADEVSRLTNWFDAQAAKFRGSLQPVTVTEAEHSNERSGDIARLRDHLYQMVRDLRGN